MDSILEAVEAAIAAVIFCLAVYLFLLLAKVSEDYAAKVNDSLEETEYCSYLEF